MALVDLDGSNESEFSGVWTSLFEPHSFVDFRLGSRPGDIDLDGDVDRLDSALFAPNLGASGATWTSGDFDADGMTTLTDLSTQQAHMGMTAPSPAPTPIPEPPAGLASLAAILGAFLTRRAVAAARRVPWRPRTHRLGLPG